LAILLPILLIKPAAIKSRASSGQHIWFSLLIMSFDGKPGQCRINRVIKNIYPNREYIAGGGRLKKTVF